MRPEPGSRGPTASAVFFGRVRHARRRPTRHSFSAGLVLFYVDLAELPELFRGRWLWSLERMNLMSFRREDYYRDPIAPDLDLADAIRNLVERTLGFRPEGAVRLLTQLRQGGYVFNPVTFYYCFDRSGADGRCAGDERLAAIVAEITNTPWGERHTYAFDMRAGGTRAFRFDKEFHISPFMPMDIGYLWRFMTPPGRGSGQLSVCMESRRSGDEFFRVVLAMQRRPWSAAALAWALVRYPLQTLRVVASIYLHAGLLKLKGAPFFAHPVAAGARAATPGSGP